MKNTIKTIMYSLVAVLAIASVQSNADFLRIGKWVKENPKYTTAIGAGALAGAAALGRGAYKGYRRTQKIKRYKPAPGAKADNKALLAEINAVRKKLKHIQPPHVSADRAGAVKKPLQVRRLPGIEKTKEAREAPHVLRGFLGRELDSNVYQSLPMNK